MWLVGKDSEALDGRPGNFGFKDVPYLIPMSSIILPCECYVLKKLSIKPFFVVVLEDFLVN